MVALIHCMTILSLLLPGVIFAAYAFEQRYRIPAGQNISRADLELHPDIRLVDIFVGTGWIDYEFCDKYNKKTRNSQYLTKLNSDLKDCVNSSSCSGISWSPKDLITVKCRSKVRVSYAVAIIPTCRYQLVNETNYVQSSVVKGSLRLDVAHMRTTCGPNSDPHAYHIISQGGSASTLTKPENGKTTAVPLINSLVEKCIYPCHSFSLSRESNYGETFVQGMNRTNDLVQTTQLTGLTILYKCEQKVEGGKSYNTTEKTTNAPVSEWLYVSVVFIVATCALVIIVLLLLRKLQLTIGSPQRELNNNQKLPRVTFREKSKKVMHVEPYATHTLVKGHYRAHHSDEAEEPSWYVDRRDEVTASRSTISTVLDEGEADSSSYYEPVAPREKSDNRGGTPTATAGAVAPHTRTDKTPAPVIRPRATLLSPPTQQPPDRASTGSYIVFVE